MTGDEIERRFAEINMRPAEELTSEEADSLAEAEAMDDGTTVSLEDFKKGLEECGGKFMRSASPAFFANP